MSLSLDEFALENATLKKCLSLLEQHTTSQEEIVQDYSNDFYSEVIRSIEAFRPARNYDLESQYQIELNGFFQS